MKKLFTYMMCCLTISVAALTFASCSNDDDENDYLVTCPCPTDGTVKDMLCFLQYDEATGQWYTYPLGTDTPFGIVSENDDMVIIAKNVPDDLDTSKSGNSITVTGSYTYDGCEPTEWGTLYRFTLYITTIAPYDGECGTEE